MGILFQKDKRTGITYAYENQAYWDKEKQQSRAKRKLIGNLDPETNEIVPTRSYKKKEKTVQTNDKLPGPVPQLTISDEDEQQTNAMMDMLLAKKRSEDRRNWLQEKGDMADIEA